MQTICCSVSSIGSDHGCPVQLPSGAVLQGTLRYLGIELDDALEMAEQTEI